jgi:demethylmenaquinone methyltransferase/2-methoxy-6-polyprenyl-1,4-benzoquinol methylase
MIEKAVTPAAVTEGGHGGINAFRLQDGVDEREKVSRVRSVFDSVAPAHDVMNDSHVGRTAPASWKRYTLTVANPQPGQQVLDIAGTGDLSLAFAKKVGPAGRVVHTDINEAMLREFGCSTWLNLTLVWQMPRSCRSPASPPFVSVALVCAHDNKEARWPRCIERSNQAASCRLSFPGGEAASKAYDWYSFNVAQTGQVGTTTRVATAICRVHPHASRAGGVGGTMRSVGFGHGCGTTSAPVRYAARGHHADRGLGFD